MAPAVSLLDVAVQSAIVGRGGTARRRVKRLMGQVARLPG